ncbi:hypothetical protein FOZ60_015450 [Perkinsus olseni]|uniref:RRM domain-containing protein n=1 Tax=Perkinsus olseni TaxID=32597 RepID=A0A7J6P5Z7_PEROL|nr:hypothetical protein FOZ60_015450 [Perkinsus olseni]
MSDTLLITGLPKNVEEQHIRAVFAGMGLLHVRLDRDSETQKPTGYAFIRFASPGLAAEALEKRGGSSNSQGMAGRVTMSARPDTVGVITEGACIDKSYQVYIGNLFPVIDSEKLTQVFKDKYEGVRAGRVIRTPPDDQGHSDSLGYGFVAFDSSAHSYSCLEEVDAAMKKAAKERKPADLASIFSEPLGPAKGLVIRPVYQPGDMEDTHMGEMKPSASSSRDSASSDPDREIFVSPRGHWARVTFVDHVNALGALSHLQGVPFNDKPLELTWHIFRRRPGVDDDADNFDSALRRAGAFGIRDTENRSAEFYESMKPQKRQRKEESPADEEQPTGTRAEWLRKTMAMLEPSDPAKAGSGDTAAAEPAAAPAVVEDDDDDSDAVILSSLCPASPSMIYTFYIFAPSGKVVYYEAYHRSRPVQNLQHEQRLLWGLIATMKSFGQAMSPLKAGAGPEGFNTFSTPEYKVHHCESRTGYMFVLTTDPTVDDMQDVMAAIYSDFFVELAVKNPLYEPGAPIDSKSCPNFAPRLRQFLQSKHQYSSLPLAFS